MRYRRSRGNLEALAQLRCWRQHWHDRENCGVHGSCVLCYWSHLLPYMNALISNAHSQHFNASISSVGDCVSWVLCGHMMLGWMLATVVVRAHIWGWFDGFCGVMHSRWIDAWLAVLCAYLFDLILADILMRCNRFQLFSLRVLWGVCLWIISTVFNVHI